MLILTYTSSVSVPGKSYGAGQRTEQAATTRRKEVFETPSQGLIKCLWVSTMLHSDVRGLYSHQRSQTLVVHTSVAHGEARLL